MVEPWTESNGPTPTDCWPSRARGAIARVQGLCMADAMRGIRMVDTRAETATIGQVAACLLFLAGAGVCIANSGPPASDRSGLQRLRGHRRVSGGEERRRRLHDSRQTPIAHAIGLPEP